MFPAEILPIVTVLANLVHFLLGLPILVAFLIYFDTPLQVAELAWFPVVVLVQLLLTVSLALILSALTVHFRDIKDILANVMTLWFFGTPILYYWDDAPAADPSLSRPEPVYAPRDFVSGDSLFRRGLRSLEVALALGFGSALLFLFAYFLFDRLRDSFAEEV